MTPEQIIEREFRKAMNDSTTPVVVTIAKDAEEIHVLYDGILFVCDCDSDAEFVFLAPTTGDYARFPIPADWFPERFE